MCSRIFNVFQPQTGAISAFLTTLRLEMMMIEICMVTITLQLCVIINMKTKQCVLIFDQIYYIFASPQNCDVICGFWKCPHSWGSPIWRILHPWKISEIHALVNGRGCWGVDALVFCAGGWVGHNFVQGGSDTREGRSSWDLLLCVCASHWIRLLYNRCSKSLVVVQWTQSYTYMCIL